MNDFQDKASPLFNFEALKLLENEEIKDKIIKGSKNHSKISKEKGFSKSFVETENDNSIKMF